MKTCYKCKQELDESCFGKNKNRYDGLQTTCKECRRKVNNEYYANSQIRKDTIKRNKTTNINKAKEFVSAIKKTGCNFCNETEECCLDLHHIDPKQKEYSISRIVNSGHKLETIYKEIEKCIVVCSNCHRKIHAGIL